MSQVKFLCSTEPALVFTGDAGVAHTFFSGETDKARAGELINVLREAKQPVPAELLAFGTTVKKKESKVHSTQPSSLGVPAYLRPDLTKALATLSVDSNARQADATPVSAVPTVHPAAVECQCAWSCTHVAEGVATPHREQAINVECKLVVHGRPAIHFTSSSSQSFILRSQTRMLTGVLACSCTVHISRTWT